MISRSIPQQVTLLSAGLKYLMWQCRRPFTHRGALYSAFKHIFSFCRLSRTNKSFQCLFAQILACSQYSSCVGVCVCASVCLLFCMFCKDGYVWSSVSCRLQQMFHISRLFACCQHIRLQKGTLSDLIQLTFFSAFTSVFSQHQPPSRLSLPNIGTCINIFYECFFVESALRCSSVREDSSILRRLSRGRGFGENARPAKLPQEGRAAIAAECNGSAFCLK